MDQIKNKAQDLLANPNSGTRRIARNFNRAGENNNRVSTFKYFWCSLFLKHHPWNVHISGDFSRTFVVCFHWIGKVFLVKFQVSCLDLYFGSMLIHLSCKSASKPLNARYCTGARSHRGRHYNCAYTVFTRFWCTPKQHIQPKLNSGFVLRHWDSKQAFYKTFAQISGSRCHLIFEQFIHVCSW